MLGVTFCSTSYACKYHTKRTLKKISIIFQACLQDMGCRLVKLVNLQLYKFHDDFSKELQLMNNNDP